MAKAVWKFELPSVITDVQMPIGAEILDVQVRHGVVCLWALVDINAPRTTRVFQYYGTGHTLEPNPGRYIGTVQMSDGYLVFHIFEKS
jgi:hypothetical protein